MTQSKAQVLAGELLEALDYGLEPKTLEKQTAALLLAQEAALKDALEALKSLTDGAAVAVWRLGGSAQVYRAINKIREVL